MRLPLWAASAAFFMLSCIPVSYAQVGEAHFRAWDKASPQKISKRKPVRRTSRSIPSRYSPAIARTAVAAIANTVGHVLPHPPGCPRRAFCGCGASVEVFGRAIPSLYLAANWLKFPKATPGPGMVAARRGHVMVIRQYLGGNRALVYDANSGRGLTRLHVRSLAGFSVRNPRA